MPAQLSAVVAPTGSPVAQLRQEGRETTTSSSARHSAVSTNARQGDVRPHQGVTARTTAGDSATGYPFMDIGRRGLAGSAPPLGVPLDGPDSLEVAPAVARGILRVLLPIAAIREALGGASRLRSQFLHSADPAPPLGGLQPARRAAVLRSESILRPRHEAPPATLQEASPARLHFRRRCS
jgi:hypothetical protein